MRQKEYHENRSRELQAEYEYVGCHFGNEVGHRDGGEVASEERYQVETLLYRDEHKVVAVEQQEHYREEYHLKLPQNRGHFAGYRVGGLHEAKPHLRVHHTPRELHRREEERRGEAYREADQRLLDDQHKKQPKRKRPRKFRQARGKLHGEKRRRQEQPQARLDLHRYVTRAEYRHQRKHSDYPRKHQQVILYLVKRNRESVEAVCHTKIRC